MTIKMEPREFATSGCSPPVTRRRYMGNNQVLTLSEVITNVDIIGNHNTLTVGTNNATIKVIGNACTVKVHKGSGKIQVVGNNSTVLISDEIDANRVHCVGNHTNVRSLQRDQCKSNNEETRDTREAASDVCGRNLVDGDCNYLSDSRRSCNGSGFCDGSGSCNGGCKNRKQSMKCPASRTCEDGGSAKGGLKEAAYTARHINGLIPTLPCLDNGPTLVQKQGYLYINNCVSVRTGTTRTKHF